MIKQVPTYAKFLKDLCTIKRGLNVSKKTFLTQQVSSIIQYKSPGCLTISVMIGEMCVEKALLGLGASVNLLPYSVYKQLGLGELKQTSITLSLVDRSVKIPRGMIENVLVQVDKFYYPVDFVVLDTDPNGVMQLTFGNMTLELNIFYMCNKQFHPAEEEGPEEVFGDLDEGLPEPLDLLATLSPLKLREEILPSFNEEKTQEATKEEPSKLILKPLPTELKCNKAIEWKISDLKGISHLVCTHHIYMEEEAKPMWCELKCLSYFRPILSTSYQIAHGKLNAVTRKDHFPLPFIDQVLERVSSHPFYCFLDGYSRYFQIEIAKDIEVDKANVELIIKLPSPTTVKGVRRFIKDFSKLARPLCELLVKDAKFVWDDRCQRSFEELKLLLTTAPIVRAPNWKLPFEVMCDASDFAIGAVLGQREDGKPYVIYYIKDKKGVENVVADHLSRLAIAHNSHSFPINDDFPEESLMLIEATPWYAHIANYLVTGEVPNALTMCRSCDRCQRLGKLTRKNMMPLNPILIVDFFYVWGINFMGPFPMSFGYSYILVGVDYVSKWVEAIPCKQNDHRVVLKFLKENIFSRFGVPKAIINDGGTHFCNKPFETLLAKYGTSGQVELANWEIKNILMKVVNTSKRDWSIKLHDSLWAYKTTYKTILGMSPYRLVYGKVITTKMQYKAWWAIKTLNMDLNRSDMKRFLDLNEMEELRNDAYVNSNIAKQRLKRKVEVKVDRSVYYPRSIFKWSSRVTQQYREFQTIFLPFHAPWPPKRRRDLRLSPHFSHGAHQGRPYRPVSISRGLAKCLHSLGFISGLDRSIF
ncbi:hypothetical protein AAG906_028352 [Vitis piasezkii]